MTEARISIEGLREAAERANRPETVYGDVQALWQQLGPLTVLALVDAVEAAHRDITSGYHDDVDLGLEAALARFDFGCDS